MIKRLIIFSFLIGMILLVDSDLFAQAPAIRTKVVLIPMQSIIIPSRVSSTIEEYKVKEGNIVKKGDILVVLDSKYYQQVFSNTEAALKEAKTKKEFSTYHYKQKVQLFQKGVVGKMEVEESKLNAELSQTKYSQALSKYRLAELDLKSCTVTSPFDGRVVKKIAKEFEFVRAGEPILKIINDKLLLAVMHFPSSSINRIKKGQVIKVKVNETGKIYKATITEISAHIDAGSRTFEAKAIVENSDGKLRSGMSGSLAL